MSVFNSYPVVHRWGWPVVNAESVILGLVNVWVDDGRPSRGIVHLSQKSADLFGKGRAACVELAVPTFPATMGSGGPQEAAGGVSSLEVTNPRGDQGQPLRPLQRLPVGRPWITKYGMWRCAAILRRSRMPVSG